MGFEMNDVEYRCPGMLKTVNAKVTSADDGFAVEVTSSDPENRRRDSAPHARQAQG